MNKMMIKALGTSAFVLAFSLYAHGENTMRPGVAISAGAVCEVSLGMSEAALPKTLERVTYDSEDGEQYRYHGKLCADTLSVDIEVSDRRVDMISIVELGFCHRGLCIGEAYEKARKIGKNLSLLFGGEEGGILALTDNQGIYYAFATDNIDVACYSDVSKCRKEIAASKLKAINLIAP